MMVNFQLLMLNPNLLKFQSPFTVGGGEVHDGQLPTPKIQKSLYSGGVGGGGG